jgi:hypothetical protein
MPRTIEQQITATYFALRIGAAVIAFTFPFLLWGGGKIAGLTLRDSMSGYYWATPNRPCPCGENPDHSCKTQGTEVDLALILRTTRSFFCTIRTSIASGRSGSLCRRARITALPSRCPANLVRD